MESTEAKFQGLTRESTASHGAHGISRPPANEVSFAFAKLLPFERSSIAYRSAIIVAILWPSNPALILARWRTSTVCYRINWRTTSHQGMGSGRPTIIGKRGVEDASQGCRIIAVGGSRDVGWTGSKAVESLGVGQPFVTKEVEVTSVNETESGHFRGSRSSIA
jgi:hypothetical protein